MISRKKEMQVRLLLKEGLPLRLIAIQTGICKQTVSRIKKSPKIGQRIPRKKIKLEGVEKKRCKTCGGIIVIEPCLICYPTNYCDEKHFTLQRLSTDRISSQETSELLRIVNDLQELHKLGLISHPLLSDLARRARNTLKGISLGST